MKKQEFLDELKRYLNILQDEEQKDILEEYSQHIEMKIESGLSEDEAIKDFGSVRELAGEILEAYHVKLKDEEHREEEQLSRKRLKRGAGMLSGAALVKACVVKTGKKLFSGVKMFLHFLGMPFSLTGKWIGWRWGNFREKSAGRTGTAEITKTKSIIFRLNRTKEKRQERKMTGFVSGIAGMAKWMCSGIIAGICWGGRMLWNCGVICATIFFGSLGLVFLYLFGVLLILWERGYPFGGIVIGSLGAVLCFASLTVFGCTFYLRKRHLCRTGETDSEQEAVLAPENRIIEESRGQNV